MQLDRERREQVSDAIFGSLIASTIHTPEGTDDMESSPGLVRILRERADRLAQVDAELRENKGRKEFSELAANKHE